MHVERLPRPLRLLEQESHQTSHNFNALARMSHQLEEGNNKTY
jgi:hypothetical protein